MNVKGNSCESAERKEKSYTESSYHIREYIYHHEQNASRNMNIKGVPGEVSDRNKKHLIRNWRKGDSYYKVGKSTVELWSILLWKGELISYEIGYLAEEVSKQSVEGAARLSLLLIVKRERREMN